MGYINTILILGGISVIAALGVAILTGYTGLFSIGHAAFMALGGYAAAYAFMNWHFPFIIALLFGGIFAGLCSLLIGFPTFRSKLTGDYFAIATFGFAEATRLLLNNTYKSLGGAFGFTGIPQLTNLPVVLIFVAFAVFFAHSFVTSQYGKNCIAVKQDEVAAQMMGVNLMKNKIDRVVHQRVFRRGCRRPVRVLHGISGAFHVYSYPYHMTCWQRSCLVVCNH